MKKEVKLLYQFADQINRDLIIRRCSSDLYQVQFENCGVTLHAKDSHITYMYGRGSTIDEALIDYAKRISGNILVDIYNPYHIVKHDIPTLSKDTYESRNSRLED